MADLFDDSSVAGGIWFFAQEQNDAGYLTMTGVVLLDHGNKGWIDRRNAPPAGMFLIEDHHIKLTGLNLRTQW